MILLDTPDIDSVLRENWRRAEKVRYAADVLVCMLTGQKYNDAAVVDFFRQAAHSDKTIIAVFNLIDWPDDELSCQHWLQTFRERTGAEVYAAYAIPRDREAAKQHQLNFHPLTAGATDLRTDLADLRFDDIKKRSFFGSLRHVLHPQHGLPTYLRSIRERSEDYIRARDQLRKMVQVRNVQGPQLPAHLIWNPIWQWMEPRRHFLERAINGVYTRIGQAVSKGLLRRPSEAKTEADFQTAEWAAIQSAVFQLLDQMAILREGQDPILVAALEPVLAGDGRRRIEESLKADYAKLPVQPDGFRQMVFETMDRFASEHPKMLGSIKYGLVASAVVRPVLTFGLMGMSVVDLAGHVFTQAAIEASVAIGGDAAVQGGGKQLSLTLLRHTLYAGYEKQRCLQLQSLLSQHLIGPAIRQIDELADVAQCPAILEAERLIAELNRELAQ